MGGSRQSFDLVHDVLGVGELAKRVQVWANAEDHLLLLAWFCPVQSCLDNIVGKLVFHHHHERTAWRGGGGGGGGRGGGRVRRRVGNEGEGGRKGKRRY